MSRRISQALVVALWAGVLSATWISVDWGRRLQRTAPEIFLGAAPLVGRNFRDGWDWRFGWGLIGAGAVAVGIVVAVQRCWFETARFRLVVIATSVSSGLFALMLALTDGRDGVLFGAADENEYLANLSSAPPAGEFVRTFVENIDDYSVHVRGHPPGFVLLLKFIDSIGLSGPWPVAMISVLSTMALPIAVLVTVRAVVDVDWARRAAPFLIVAPSAVWMITSADAFYAALGAWGVACVAVGLNNTGRGSWAFGACGGTLLSLLLFMTYGGAVYTIIPLTLVAWGWFTKRQGTSAAVVGAVIAAMAMTLAWAVAGFWWFDGASATREEYWKGTAQFRIWNYFIFANLVAALFAIGPATFHALTRLKNRSMWVIVGGGLAALITADLSQLSKAEVERIWLIFYPWLVIAGATLVVPFTVRLPILANRTISRTTTWAGWVAIQAACAIALQAALVSKW